MYFPCKENENSLRQHCLEFQDAYLCKIWYNLNKYLRGLPQKNTYWARKHGMKFSCKENENSLGNIVCNSKMHPCAQYEIIWANYAMNVIIRLIIWLESHESSHLITHFWEHFFENYYRIASLLFFLVTWSHIMTQCEGFPIFWFFWIFMPVSKCGQNGRLDVPC